MSNLYKHITGKLFLQYIYPFIHHLPRLHPGIQSLKGSAGAPPS